MIKIIDMKKVFLTSLVLVSIIAFNSCTKEFADVNTDKNVPTEVTPDLLISGVMRSVTSQNVSNAWGIGNLVAQYNAKIQFVNEDRYLWNEQNGVWNNTYSNYRNLQNVINGLEGQQNNSYLGVALVLKSYMFETLTAAYGDAPYTEAGQAKSGSIYLPKYDAQESIYNGILADLKKANEILAASTNALGGDIIYNGGTGAILKWRKLANSLRIRYLIRLSKKRNIATELRAIVGDPANNPIFTSNADNAELKYLALSPNQWPLYDSRVGSFDEIRVSKTLSDRLSALNDPRLNVFGRPSQSSVAANAPKVEGIPNGLGDVQALNFNGGPQGVSRVGYTFACLVCNDAGQAAPDPTAPRSILMTYSQLQLLLAEAREKGWITTGDAATYYANGVNSNFDYWKAVVPGSYGITITPSADYLAQPSIAYTGTQDEKLNKIYLQLWIANYFTNLEGWFEWRRTGSPAIVPGPNNLNNNLVPVRFIYPVIEQSLNGPNRSEAVSRQGGTDDLNTKMWLLK
jgi:hypothetical protein